MDSDYTKRYLKTFAEKGARELTSLTKEDIANLRDTFKKTKLMNYIQFVSAHSNQTPHFVRVLYLEPEHIWAMEVKPRWSSISHDLAEDISAWKGYTNEKYVVEAYKVLETVLGKELLSK